MAGRNDNKNDRNNEMVPYQPSTSTSLIPLSHSINLNQVKNMTSELCSKSIQDYSAQQSLQNSNLPAVIEIETETKHLLTIIPLERDPSVMQNLLQLIVKYWDRILSTGKNLLENKYHELFGTSFEHNWSKADKHTDWSYVEKMVFTFKETLTPIFVKSMSPLIQPCIIDILGAQYAPLVEIIFKSGAVQHLLTLIIEHIYAKLGGPGAKKPLNWRAIIIHLALFILQLFLIILANWAILTFLREYTLITFFLYRTTPQFIIWITNKMSSMLLT